MKNKFQRMTKEEQKKVLTKYYATKTGKENKARFLRLLIFGYLCLLYAVVVIGDTIINHHSNWNYVLAGIMVIFGLFFLLARHKVLITKVNEYVVKHK